MNRSSDLNSKVEAALHSLEGIKRAEPGPFFFTRLMAKMNREDNAAWSHVVSFITRPMVVLAGLAIVILCNVIAAYRDSRQMVPVQGESLEQAYADDYSVNTTSLYDYENPEP